MMDAGPAYPRMLGRQSAFDILNLCACTHHNHGFNDSLQMALRTHQLRDELWRLLAFPRQVYLPAARVRAQQPDNHATALRLV